MNPIRPIRTEIRFLPEVAFPPYTYVPGHAPHPESDPAGHSFGNARLRLPRIDPADWHACRTYLRGLDLFNAGFYWESHVEFEALWLAEGRKGKFADFLKALIHLAAAGVKSLEGKPAGVTSHVRRASELVALVHKQHGSVAAVLGLRLEDLLELMKSISSNGWPSPKPLLLPVRVTE